jgi:hypothetical protein
VLKPASPEGIINHSFLQFTLTIITELTKFCFSIFSSTLRGIVFND